MVLSNQNLMFFEEITKWVDDGSPVDVVYLDFQKAFDKVPHQRLILKLKAHGIDNDVIICTSNFSCGFGEIVSDLNYIHYVAPSVRSLEGLQESVYCLIARWNHLMK